MFSIFLLFSFLFFFLGREYNRKSLSPNTEPAISREEFLRCCSWLLSFWQARWCVRVGYSVMLHTLRTWQGTGCLVGFQTQQLCVGHTSSPFLTSTTAVFLKAAVPRSLLAFASSTLIFIHAQIKLLLTVNCNCSHPSGLWQPVALVCSFLGMDFEYTVIYHFKVSLDKLS